LSKIEFCCNETGSQKDLGDSVWEPPSRLRVQRYGDFLNWQNVFKDFFGKELFCEKYTRKRVIS
ncbi:MAG: hypothetical protein KBT29_10395, partial [Prevotellaceae bacterium]|nr:hypothetical protein [Candidatus Minthosoma caballi]